MPATDAKPYSKGIPAVFGRQCCYYLLGGSLVITLLWQLAFHWHAETFHEGGPVENLQLAELLLAGGLFGLAALRRKEFSFVAWLLGGLCLFAACRELDNLFDRLLPVVGWKFGGLFALIPAVLAIRRRRAFFAQACAFMQTTACAMMFAAFLLIVPLAQGIGHKVFLAQLMPDAGHYGAIKELIEESLETVGYFVLICSAVEFLCNTRKPKE